MAAKKPRQWYGLVVHHTAGHQTDTVESERAYHLKKGYRDIGYHYFFEMDDKGRFHLKPGRSTEYQGCHGDAHANKYMLGVCVAGNYEKETLTEEQYQDVLGGVLHILKKYVLRQRRSKGIVRSNLQLAQASSFR